MTEDPIRDGMNWYVYCNSNPIAFVDPSGCVIQLVGSDEEKMQMLSHMQMLTDHIIDYDSEGYVYVNKYIDSSKYEYGNELILRMIDNSNVATIQITDGRNVTSYGWKATHRLLDGADALVSINVDKKDIVYCLSDSGKMIKTELETYIALAHELIHADRAMRGVAIPDKKSHTIITK